MRVDVRYPEEATKGTTWVVTRIRMRIRSGLGRLQTKTPASPGRGNSWIRLADRYVGIPLVFSFGSLRRRRSMPLRLRRIGLLNTAAIGDTVLMTGPIADLRAGFPDAELIFFSGPSNYEIASLIDNVDQVFRLPVFNPLGSLRILRDGKLDILLDFGPWSRLNALLTMYSGAGYVVGFRTRGQARHFGYDLAVEHLSDVHELENQRRIVRALGVETNYEPRLLCGSSGGKVKDFDQGSYVVFHLWPGGSAPRRREWPIERWVALAEHLARRSHRIVFTGAGSQRDSNEVVIDRMHTSLRHLAHNAAGISLSESLQLVNNAKLVVSVNTGVMHIAAALGAPLVALNGPTRAERWGPVSEKAIMITSPLTSSGYLDLGFENPKNPPPCMEAICYECVRHACDGALRSVNADNSEHRSALVSSSPCSQFEPVALRVVEVTTNHGRS
jgi:ADP-heptose:LPS heptosyltransferase